MRPFILSLPLLIAFGCASEVNRYDGPGCQPACRDIDTDGDTITSAECLDEDNGAQSCAEIGQITPACAGGVLTCDTETGLPECMGAAEANLRPTCSR